jgi:hypothetical protein
MEVAALAALIGLGYVLTKGSSTEAENEGFGMGDRLGPDSPVTPGRTVADEPPFPRGGQPAYLYPEPRTAPGATTVPGSPRQPNVAHPYTVRDQLSPSVRNTLFASPVPATAMNIPGVEAPPDYNSGKTVISSLTGLPMSTEEFTHNNMTPFFRGSVKQNVNDEANRSKLDAMVGTGYDQIEKREQAPLFDPQREPTGNVNGMESFTNYAQDRIVVSSNRSFEKPMESVMVGPGIKQGYSSLPIGGYQQFEVLEESRRYGNVDELRVASKPKLTYGGMVIQGKAIGTERGEIGEVRKYHPDRFFMNEHGERNFTSAVSEITKPQIRSTQMFKHQSRPEMGAVSTGPAVASDSTATYATPSFRAPHSHQNDAYGFRNADGTGYAVSDTDAAGNDYGAGGVELPVNQRNVTSERGQALNYKPAGVPQALTVYDPNDVARTTVRETTGANDYIGTAVGVEAQKLTVYDPTDILRITHRNTNAEVDTALNVTRAGMPGQRTLQFPDGWKPTAKAQLAGASAWTGAAGQARAKGEQVYDTAYAMRQNPIKELTAQGRTPEAGNGNLPVFNGEDNVNLTYRKITNDVLNDRDNTVNRVVGPGASVEDIGIARPRQILQINVARDRNTHDVLDMLDDNPYALPVYRIAQQAPAARAVAGYEGFPMQRENQTQSEKFQMRNFGRQPGPAEMSLSRA